MIECLLELFALRSDHLPELLLDKIGASVILTFCYELQAILVLHRGREVLGHTFRGFLEQEPHFEHGSL